MSKKIDNVVPREKWEFDKEVTDVFENMLERSIPQYEVMRDAVASLVKDTIMSDKRVKKGAYDILDIGCSDGLMLDKLVHTLDNDGNYVGIDVSEPMLEKARERFANRSISDRVDIRYCDLRYEFPEFDSVYDIITSILTIQFIPIEYRQDIIQNVYDNLSGRGAFIMVEKVLGNSAKLDNLFVKNYYDMKRANGYTDEQIERKRLSLEGVLVPMTNDWNIQLLRQAGFKHVDVFWRWMNFVGYVAIK